MTQPEPTSPLSPEAEQDTAAVDRLEQTASRIEEELRKRIVGQQRVVDHLMVALFARGHALLVGVPGLAKTLMVTTLADTLDLEFNRIQFTPDLMPVDITGLDILEEDQATGKRHFRFVKGPIFCNVLLADEINRTPPKTQAALLQCMQEQRATIEGKTHELPRPFVVFATRNPIEQEGTYPLPEAQLDRFMLQVEVPYPELEDEEEIVRSTTGGPRPEVKRLLTPEEILPLQDLVLRVPVPDHVVRFAVRLARLSRPNGPGSPDFVGEYLTWGASPRAAQHLVLAAKARAILDGRYVAHLDDARELAGPVLSHRLIPNFRAEAEGIRGPELVARLVELAGKE